MMANITDRLLTLAAVLLLIGTAVGADKFPSILAAYDEFPDAVRADLVFASKAEIKRQEKALLQEGLAIAKVKEAEAKRLCICYFRETLGVMVSFHWGPMLWR